MSSGVPGQRISILLQKPKKNKKTKNMSASDMSAHNRYNVYGCGDGLRPRVLRRTLNLSEVHDHVVHDLTPAHRAVQLTLPCHFLEATLTGE